MRFARDAVITIVIFIAVVFLVAYTRIRAGGLSADAEPGSMERSVAMRLVRLSIPADIEQQQSPLQGDPDTWRTAIEHYEDHCVMCHGADGHAHTDVGQNMYPKVPDFADADVQHLSDGSLFHIIQNGIRWTGMPGWSHEHSPDETWRLVSFIRKVPVLTQQDLESAGVDLDAEHRHTDNQTDEHRSESTHSSEPVGTQGR